MRRIAVVLILMGSLVEAQTNRLFVYYPTWAAPTMKPEDLKFPAGIQTIYMHFSSHVKGEVTVGHVTGTVGNPPTTIETGDTNYAGAYTTVSHGYRTGDSVVITGNPNSSLNGRWLATKVSTTKFSVPVNFAANMDVGGSRGHSRGSTQGSTYFAAAYETSDSSDLANVQTAFIDTCHNAGQKVILSLTAQGGDGTILTDVSNNTTNRKAFVSSVVAYLIRKEYDGIDLDHESGLDSHAVHLLIKEFRDTIDARMAAGSLLTMATHSDPWIYPGIWGFYNTGPMNAYLDAYFGMNYVMNTNERSWGSLGGSGGIWRCMLDCPYQKPVLTPWAPGGSYEYWSQDMMTNSLVPWFANGADTTKYGIGLWCGGTTMLNSNSGMIPGSEISYGTPGYVTYSTVLGGTSNYVPEADHYWGIVGGLYCSWIDSAGAYKRTKWAKDTMNTHNFMLYDAYSGFLPTGSRYGRQPHFDAMVNAITGGAAPTGRRLFIKKG